MTLRLAIDLDNTICENKKSGQEYSDVLPMKDAVETLKTFRNRGYYIIIFTARNMRTFEGNVGKINKFQAPIIIDWLQRWEIPYDELVLGKPHVDFLIDDKGIEFKNNWIEVSERLLLEEERNKK